MYELDDSAYTELKSKVAAAIELIKANRLTIFKLFTDVDSHIKDLSGQLEQTNSGYERELLERRDKEITGLVDRIRRNQ